MNTGQDWIKTLELLPHPEGGYYKEIYRADSEVISQSTGLRRNALTSIYFFLGEKDKSHFHILSSDEIWYFHAGNTTRIHFISAEGEYSFQDIGSDASLQVIIPKNTHFAAEVLDKQTGHFILVSCAVAPGFEFEDFKLSSRDHLQNICPEKAEFIADFSLID